MTKREEIFDLIKKYKELHREEYGIKKIGVFGSLTKKSKENFNDVDIVVDLDSPNLFHLIAIKQELEEFLGFGVDIVRYRSKMNPYLKKHIDNEAVYV